MINKAMEEKNQYVFEFSLKGSSEQVNTLLDEGYEIADIIPIHQNSGGAIYSRARGNYVLRVLVLLTPSERRTKFYYKIVNLKDGYTASFNQLLEEQNKLGFKAFKILPLDVLLDPEAHSGIGKGTYGFGVFFIKDLENKLEDQDAPDSGD